MHHATTQISRVADDHYEARPEILKPRRIGRSEKRTPNWVGLRATELLIAASDHSRAATDGVVTARSGWD